MCSWNANTGGKQQVHDTKNNVKKTNSINKCKLRLNCCWSGDETLKPQADIECGSISSDEENEASIDVTSPSDIEDDALSDSDVGGIVLTPPSTRPQHLPAQVCAFYGFNSIYIVVCYF